MLADLAVLYILVALQMTFDAALRMTSNITNKGWITTSLLSPTFLSTSFNNMLHLCLLMWAVSSTDSHLSCLTAWKTTMKSQLMFNSLQKYFAVTSTILILVAIFWYVLEISVFKHRPTETQKDLAAQTDHNSLLTQNLISFSLRVL